MPGSLCNSPSLMSGPTPMLSRLIALMCRQKGLVLLFVTDVCIFSLSQVFINCGSDFAIGIPILRLTRLLGTIIQFLFLSNKGFCLSIKPW